MSYFQKNKWAVLAFVLLILMNLGMLTAFWYFNKTDNKREPLVEGNPIQFLVASLQLDSVQQEQVILLRDEHRSQVRDVREKNREAKDAFFALLQQQGITNEQVEKAATTAAQYDRELSLITFRHFQKIRALCRPDQQQKFDSLINEVLHTLAQGPAGGPPPRPPMDRQGPPPPHRDGPPQ